MSVSTSDILDGVVIIGSQFSEPMRVVGTPTAGDGFVLVNLVGTRTSTFRGGVTLTKTDLGSIQIERKEAVFGGKPIRLDLASSRRLPDTLRDDRVVAEVRPPSIPQRKVKLEI